MLVGVLPKYLTNVSSDLVHEYTSTVHFFLKFDLNCVRGLLAE